MTRQEMKANARQTLGNQIFDTKWLVALLVILVADVIAQAVGSISMGIVMLLATGPLSYGVASMFIKQARDQQPMNFQDLFNGFTGDFLGNFLIALMSGLFVFLWSLLFVIPGIICVYRYRMCWFIKADHPEYDWSQTLKESRRIMHGHKWELFVLDLSFIGWYIVGVLCLGIGTLWVSPYHMAAKAQFYESIR